ncbi:hypothetical protein [Pseudomonas phage IR-QUMS-PaBa1-GHS-2021]|nr:hypothetical protein [Pseudomonas phage IR-QUMS-PaBa1-GHS-2021]
MKGTPPHYQIKIIARSAFTDDLKERLKPLYENLFHHELHLVIGTKTTRKLFKPSARKNPHPSVIEKRYEDFFKVTDKIVLVTHLGEAVGYLAVVKNKITSLFVEEDFRKLGLGRIMVSKLQRGGHPVNRFLYVQCFTQNTAGINFYRKVGFKEIDRGEIYTVLLME